ENEVVRSTHWGTASGAGIFAGRSSVCSRAVQCDDPALGIPIDAGNAAAHHRLAGKEARYSSGEVSGRSRRNSRGRERDSRSGKADPGTWFDRGEDPHSRGLSPRSGALYRKGFYHSRFRRRTSPTVERTQTETFSVARCSRNDALLSVRRL